MSFYLRDFQCFFKENVSVADEAKTVREIITLITPEHRRKRMVEWGFFVLFFLFNRYSCILVLKKDDRRDQS